MKLPLTRDVAELLMSSDGVGLPRRRRPKAAVRHRRRPGFRRTGAEDDGAGPDLA
jgi:hypothetical protein